MAPMNGSAIHEAVRRTVGQILDEGRTVAKAMEAAGNAMTWVDQMIDQMGPSTPKLGCSNGCSWCCYQSVPATAPEIFRLMAYMTEKLDHEQRKRAAARIIDIDDKTRGLTTKERFHPDWPCPLLENGACVVYSSRPLACRGMSSLDDGACETALTDPEVRRQMVEEDAAPIPGFRPHLEIAGAVASGQQDGLNDAGLMGQPLELNRGLRIALEDGSDVMRAWIDGEPVFDAAAYREAAPMWFLDQFGRR